MKTKRQFQNHGNELRVASLTPLIAVWNSMELPLRIEWEGSLSIWSRMDLVLYRVRKVLGCWK